MRWLAETCPALAVVVLTGLADEHLGAEAVRAGAQDYLVKGQVDGAMLNRVIRYAVSGCAGRRSSGSCVRPRSSPGRTPGWNAACCPLRCCPTRGSRWRRRTGPAAGRACSAGTSSTLSRRPTAGCTRWSAMSAGAGRRGGARRLPAGGLAHHGAGRAGRWRDPVGGGAGAGARAPAGAAVRHAVHAVDRPDRTHGRLHLAGHPPPLLITVRPGRELAAPACPPPVVARARLAEHRGGARRALVPVMYTDGLIEGRIGEGPERLGSRGPDRHPSSFLGSARVCAGGRSSVTTTSWMARRARSAAQRRRSGRRPGRAVLGPGRRLRAGCRPAD